jgi:hypothetical protein
MDEVISVIGNNEVGMRIAVLTTTLTMERQTSRQDAHYEGLPTFEVLAGWYLGEFQFH